MNVLPIALLGVAAFFVYRYYQTPAASSIGTPDGTTVTPSPGGGSSSGGGGTVGGGSSGSSGSGSTGTGGGPSSSAPPPPAQQLSHAQILQGAAAGIPEYVAAAEQRGWNLNVDQWNWYREQAGADPIDPMYMPALIGDADRSTVISASEYRRRLSSNGLGGLGYLVSAAELWRWQ